MRGNGSVEPLKAANGCRWMVLLLACLPISGMTSSASSERLQDAGYSLLRFVNPFIGTAGTGHTTPAACVPFGLVQAGPDTGHIGWDYCSGYQYGDGTICGFSQTHLNGTGWMDLGDAMLLPVTDAMLSGAGDGDVRSAIDKTSERAKCGYYRVKMTDARADVEITAAEHVAVYRIRFEGSGERKILIDSQYGIVYRPENLLDYVLASDVRALGTSAVCGTRRSKFWVERALGFKVEFSKPFVRVERLAPRHAREKGPRHVAVFNLMENEPLLVKVALSASGSLAAAERNLAVEVPDWDFDRVRRVAEEAWSGILNRIEVSGSETVKTNFYTSLYHLCVQPNNIADCGEMPFYSTFSLWDTYRAAHPFYTLLTPERVPTMVDSIVTQARKTGYLPIWTLWGHETQSMIGVHSIPVLVDAYLKGLRGDTNWDEVMDMIEDTLTVVHPARRNENRSLQDRYGFVPYDIVRGQGVSIVMEDRYDDACAARLAGALGRKDRESFFRFRSAKWRNVFDGSLGLVRGRNSMGGWRNPFDPFLFGHGSSKNNDFTEGNAWQWTWHVMQDPDGLVAAMGGRENALKRLDGLYEAPSAVRGDHLVLDITGLIGQLVHGNEPSHHIPYFYSRLGERDKTAEKVREICTRFYRPTPDGLCGNDDCGQMSAWYLFSALGFYPFDPCGGEYVLGAPQVPRAVVRLGNGRTFTIEASAESGDRGCASSVALNGVPVESFAIRHEDIMRGGVLRFELK